MQIGPLRAVFFVFNTERTTILSGLPQVFLTVAAGTPAALHWSMRQQKITLREMLSSGPTRLLVYCGDYKCAHSVARQYFPGLAPCAH